MLILAFVLGFALLVGVLIFREEVLVTLRWPVDAFLTWWAGGKGP